MPLVAVLVAHAAATASCASASGEIDLPAASTPGSARVAPIQADPYFVAQPARTFASAGPPIAVQTRMPVNGTFAVSPDGLLVAVNRAETASVAFLDVDRDTVVAVTAPPPGAHGPATGARWIDDGTLVMETSVGVAVYDGMSGALRGVAAGELLGVVHEGRAFATMSSSASSGRAMVTIQTFANPATAGVRIQVRGSVKRVLDLGADAFAVCTDAGLQAFASSGQALWSIAGPDFGAAAQVRGTGLLVADDGEQVRIVDATTGKERTPVESAKLASKDATVSPFVLIATGDAISVVDLRDPKPPALVERSVKAFEVGPDGMHAAIATKEGDILIADLRAGTKRKIGAAADVSSIGLTPDLRFVTVVDGSRTRVLRGDGAGEVFGLPGRCTLHPAANGALRLASCRREPGWRSLPDLPFDIRGAGTPGFAPAAIDLEERFEGSKTVRIEHGTETSFTARCGANSTTLGAAPRGEQTRAKALAPFEDPVWITGGDVAVAMGRYHSPLGADIWDVTGGAKLAHIEAPPDVPRLTAAVSPDGTLVATNAFGSTKIEVRRPKDGSARTLDQKDPVARFAFHPAGKLIVATKKEPKEWWNDGEPWSPDDESNEGSVQIWDPASGTLLKTIEGNEFAISGDGSKLFVTRPRRGIRAYDFGTSRIVGQWLGWLAVEAAGFGGRFVALRELGPPPQGSMPHAPPSTVSIRVHKLGSSASRLRIASAHAGLAFSPDEKALAVSPTLIDAEFLGSHELRVYETASGKQEFAVPLHFHGGQPFFLANAVGVETGGGILLVRRTDQRMLEIRGFADGTSCDVLAVDASGAFQGQPNGGLVYRLGNDLRTSEVVTSGPLFEQKRKNDLLEAFFADR